MDASKSWDTSYEWKTVALLTLGFGLVGLDRWIVAPLAPSMIGDLHLTPQDINNLVAILGIAWGVAAIFLGMFYLAMPALPARPRPAASSMLEITSTIS